MGKLAVRIVVSLLFFVSGACGLLYQVVWTRKLVLLLGASSYAVSTVLSIFFLGLGLGSLLGGRLADRGGRPLTLYAVFEIVIGLWAMAFILLIDRSEGLVVYVLRAGAFSPGIAVVLRALLSSVFLLVPVCLMGATLPLLSRFVTTDPRCASTTGACGQAGGRVGSLYSVNTFGAVAGCALTGFWLLPRFGYNTSTFVGMSANVFIGLLALVADRCGGSAGRRSTRAVSPFIRRLLRGTPLVLVGVAAVYAYAYEILWPQLVLLLVVGATAAFVSVALSGREGLRAVPAGGTSSSRSVSVLVLSAFAVSGFCGLAYEVLWTRLLATIFLGTTYAFTTMLATLLFGIAVGSAVASAWADRSRHPVSVLGAIQMAAGASGLAMLRWFPRLPDWLQRVQQETGANWADLSQARFVLSFLVIFVPTFLSGMTFPIVVRSLSASGDRVGRRVGLLYSLNTFGGLLGAIVGGYLVIPHVGVHRGIVLLSVVLFAAGLLLVVSCPTRGGLKKAALAVAGCILAAAAWSTAPGDVSRALTEAYVPSDQRVIDFREGIEGTVAVSEPSNDAGGADRVLWINAVQATASIEKGVRMNRLQGVLPLLFDRDPRTVLFMCFGSGITAGTLGLYDFERIDAVEISSDVLRMARHFAVDNFDVVDNPRLKFIIDDGRNFLLTTPNRYDVITFEPMPLALSGVSSFYTEEYYRLCLGRLAGGGLVSQWVPLHSLDIDVVRSLCRTFTSVFPHYCAWYINADLFLIGSDRPLAIDYAALQKRLAVPGIQDALKDAGFDDLAEVVACFFMGPGHLAEFSRGGRLMTDSRPWAEFVAPKLMYRRTVEQSIEELQPFFESPEAYVLFDGIGEAEREAALSAIRKRFASRAKVLEGLKSYYGGILPERPEEEFRAALALDPADCTARYYVKETILARAHSLIRQGEIQEAVGLLEGELKNFPGATDVRRLLEETRLRAE